MNDELYHSRGAWKTHKYLKKIGNRYIYAKDQMTGAARSAGNTMQQMRAQASKQVANAKRAARQAIISGRQTAKRVRTRVNEATGVNARKRMQTYAGDYVRNQRRSAAATQNYRSAQSRLDRSTQRHNYVKTQAHRIQTQRRPDGKYYNGQQKQAAGVQYHATKKRMDIDTQARNKALQNMTQANKRTQNSRLKYQANKKAYENSIAGKVDKGVAKAKKIAKQKGQASRRALNKMIGVGAKERRDAARREYARTTANAAKAQQNANNAQRSANAAKKYVGQYNARTNAVVRGNNSAAAKDWANKRRAHANTVSSNAQRLANNAQGKANTAKRYADNARKNMNAANKAYDNSILGRVDKAKKKGREVFNSTKRKVSGVYSDFQNGKYGKKGTSQITITSQKLSGNVHQKAPSASQMREYNRLKKNSSMSVKSQKLSGPRVSKSAPKKNNKRKQRRSNYSRTTGYRRPI